MNYILKTFNPEIFQGENKRNNYFEGWYFKFNDETEQKSISIIPGVSFGDTPEDSHAFIQLIDAIDYKTLYLKYNISEFKYSKSEFDITIGNSSFSRNKINLNMKNDDFDIKGELKFFEIVPFPKTIFNPGIMGPFSFLPFMECYHGIVNIQHKIQGSLLINNQQTSFTNGTGYIEKDWGKSFPESWVWIQSNHFEQKDVSLMFSIAKIPYFHSYFTGFVTFLRIKDQIYRFATYSGAKIRYFQCENEHITIIVGDKNRTMTIKANYKKSGILKAPQNGIMHREISESISSVVEVTLSDNKSQLIFHGFGKNVGMEIVGEILI